MAVTTDSGPGQGRRNARYAYVGANMAQTGIQLIAPALPLMGLAFALSDSQIGLISSVYLLPGAIAAIPAGILADRIGRRRVFGWAMILFGLCGVAIQFTTGNFTAFLVVRGLQGVTFAGMLPLTMTILGDSFQGPDLIKAQGRRTVAMHLGDGTLPIIGGLLVTMAWQVAWLGQLLAIPFGIMVLRNMHDPPEIAGKSRRLLGFRDLMKLFRTPAILALQYAGFLRMFLKFGIITYLPVLMVTVRDFTPAFAGLAVGSAALAGIIPAFFAGNIAEHGKPTTFIAIGLFVEGIALAGLALFAEPALILGSGLVFGFADGLSAVYSNSFVAAATGAEQRASFVATTGAIRNFAKFMAPATLAALTLLIPLTTTFAIMAVITTISALLALPLRGLEHKLTAEKLGH